RRPTRARSAPISPTASTQTRSTAPTGPTRRAPRSHSSSRRSTCIRADRGTRRGVMNASKGNEATKVRLLGLDREALERQCADWGQKPFRARQLLRWIHQRGVDDFDAMTDLAQEFRGVLARHACVEAPPVLADHESADGTRKWLLDVGGGNA